MSEQTAALAVKPAAATAIESVLIGGDLAKLSAEQRVAYYNRTCESLGLNPLTKPFDYLSLSGKLVLYAKKDCTDQLRKIHGVSVQIVSREKLDGDVFAVTARAVDKTGRSDESIGAVPLGNLKGEALSNQLMRAETKAKRRVTLSICGLGMLDESEVDSVPGASRWSPPEGAAPSPSANGSLRAAVAAACVAADQDMQALLKHLGVESLEEMSVRQCQQALVHLKQKQTANAI